MKNIFYLALAVLLLGCDDFTDIEPKGVVIPETVEHYQGLIQDLSITGSSPIHYALASDDVFFTDEKMGVLRNWQVNVYSWADHTFTPEENDFDWGAGYKEISNCNIVINNIDAAEGDEAIKEVTKGEALFHRAHTYFQLINIYGKVYGSNSGTDLGVPLVLLEQINQGLPRETVEKVYEQIVNDLTEALTLLPETGINAYHPTKIAVYGMLTRVYLFMENYPALIDAGTEFFKLKSYDDILDMNGFYFPYTFLNPEHFFNQFPAVNLDAISGSYISNDLISLFEPTDIRMMFYATPEGDNFLWNDYQQSLFPSVGLTVPEVALNLAEGYARTSDKDMAVELVSEVQNKRHIAGSVMPIDASGLSQDESIDLVLKERRLELMFSGKRFFDLKRLNKEARTQVTITRTINGNTFTIEPSDLRYQMAIPRDIISLNGNIEQNPR